ALLYEPTIHVPLIIRMPGAAPGVVSDLCQHHDLLPTIAYLTGITLTSPTTGLPLAPFSTGTSARHFTISQQDGGAAIRAIRTHGHKLICHYDLEQDRDTHPAKIIRTEFYDLASDPFELSDLANQNLPQMHELLRKLEEWRQTMLAG